MAARTGTLADLLAAKEMIVVCGSGGTGKTTIAAALGAQAAASIGGKVLVLTVDPARRLATALGIDHVGDTPIQVPAVFDGDDATRPRGELWMAMLDTKAGWDALVRRHAASPDVAQRILDNPLYRNITSRFVHSHDYIAVERMHELHGTGAYDVLIIDTPPSRNALDLLDAPRRMREFFGSRLLRWLTVPARSRMLSIASQPFYQVADRILGGRFLRDIAEFFGLLQTMEAGFVRRAREVEALLTDGRTSFLVVTTLEPAPAAEAQALIAELQRRHYPLGALVANRVLPSGLRSPAAAKAAKAMAVVGADDRAVRTMASHADESAADVAAVLQQIGARFPDLTVVAAREAERGRDLAALGVPVVEVPLIGGDVTDLSSLLVVGHALLR
jgi:anion-transporting  ArsA/GET3 family ATPase